MPRFLKAPSGSSIEERLAYYSRPGKNGCRVWVGYIDCVGYGRLQFEHYYQKAHRLAWRFANGPIPGGMKVLHKCDNRRCINPDHLFIGTQKDNVADMILKGRHGTKTTVHKVRQIMKATGSYAEISRRFGLSAGTIRRIKIGEGWKHVTSARTGQ
jgi:hypothetical protein